MTEEPVSVSAQVFDAVDAHEAAAPSAVSVAVARYFEAHRSFILPWSQSQAVINNLRCQSEECTELRGHDGDHRKPAEIIFTL
ncbi:hypothetical protein ACT3TB_16430 [Micrococcaceae sp. AOP34-BR2-30]